MAADAAARGESVRDDRALAYICDNVDGSDSASVPSSGRGRGMDGCVEMSGDKGGASGVSFELMVSNVE